MWSGFAVVTRMEGKWQFLFYSLAIWTCYYMQLYVAFRVPVHTEPLRRSGARFRAGALPCGVCAPVSIGMAVPSNGGLGPWNIAVMFGLAVYGVSDAQGTAFSMLQWSGQTVMLILLGIYTMVYITFYGKKKKNPFAGTVAARGGKTMNYES